MATVEEGGRAAPTVEGCSALVVRREDLADGGGSIAEVVAPVLRVVGVERGFSFPTLGARLNTMLKDCSL